MMSIDLEVESAFSSTSCSRMNSCGGATPMQANRTAASAWIEAGCNMQILNSWYSIPITCNNKTFVPCKFNVFFYILQYKITRNNLYQKCKAMLQQGPITHRARRIISSRPAETIHFNILDSLRLEQACKERDILRENIIYYQNATTKLSFIGFRPTISSCLQLGKNTSLSSVIQKMLQLIWVIHSGINYLV